MTYDDDGYLLSETNGENETTYFENDEYGNIIETCDARSSGPADDTYVVTSTWTGITRNETSRTLPPTSEHPSGATTAWTYSTGVETAEDGGTVPPGLLLTETDANGGTSTMEYNSAGDLVRVIDRVGLVVEYNYDELGRQIVETQLSDTFPAGVTTTTVFDEIGQPIQVTGTPTTNAVTGDAHQFQVITEFDGDGNAVEILEHDIAGSPTASPERRTSFAFDSADRLVSVTDPEGGQRLENTTNREHPGNRRPRGSPFRVRVRPTRPRAVGEGDRCRHRRWCRLPS